MLTAERLREVLDYDPETGVFRWRIRTSIRIVVGKPAGNVGKGKDSGYLRIQIDGEMFLGHRLAFLWMTGQWPEADVDHENGIRHDNKWSNLREASRSQNLGNMRIRADNTSGYKGVWYHRRLKKWAAECQGEKLGVFLTKQEAASAYQAEATRVFGEFARF